MRSDIISFIDKCIPCSITQDKIHMECSVLNSCVHMDISGPWNKDSNGYIYRLVMVEASTRFTILAPIKKKAAKNMSNAILTHYIGFKGVPNHL